MCKKSERFGKSLQKSNLYIFGASNTNYIRDTKEILSFIVLFNVSTIYTYYIYNSLIYIFPYFF